MDIKDLTSELDLHLLESKIEHDNNRKASKYYSPSMLADCKRKIQFHKLNCQKEITDTAQGIMRLDNGSYNHRRYVDYWRSLGVLHGDWYCLSCEGITPDSLCPVYCGDCGRENTLEYNEVPVVSEEFLVRGKADGILILKGERVLWEFKTINNKGFKLIIKNDRPKDEHILQANIYATLLDVKHILLRYENKDTQECKDFQCEQSDSLFKEVIRKIEIIETSFESCILLPMECNNIKIPPAIWCPYKNFCFSSKLTFNKVLENFTIKK